MIKTKLDNDRQYVIGTAGHIDHGKTALVKALTGIDTDRLPEEKERGITIDIGFAHLDENITIIDVPGHERLIKNMVAGVSTIDMVLFVVAADDGVMPQSREHLDIINLLQIRHGMVVITKSDLADEDWLMLVEEDMQMLLKDTALENAPILRTSAAKGEGIAALHEMLYKTLAAIPPRQDMEVFRQPVDRVFSVKGFGTVITGTVLSGSINSGDAVEIQPAGIEARVRGLQTHDQDVAVARTGFRSAVNLAGIDLAQVARGMVLSQPGLYAPVEIINARITLLASSPAPMKSGQRVRLHIHTAEAFARVLIPSTSQLQPGQSAYVQLRLEQPVHAAFQDRFIIRQYSPQRTLGGGVVLQTNPFRFRKKYLDWFNQSLTNLEAEEESAKIAGTFDYLRASWQKLWDLKVKTNLPLQSLQKCIKEMVGKDALFSANVGGKTVYFSRAQMDIVLERIIRSLEKYHEKYPGRAGMSEGEMVSLLEKWFDTDAIRRALAVGAKRKQLAKAKQSYRLSTFAPKLEAKDSAAYQEIEVMYREARFSPPTIKEVMAALDLPQKAFKEIIRLLRGEGTLVYVDETLLFHKSVFPELKALLADAFRKKAEITVPEFKALTGTTRKHSIPLLTYLDSNQITERDGDVRRPGFRLEES